MVQCPEGERTLKWFNLLDVMLRLRTRSTATETIGQAEESLSWRAPIIPGHSLAGIHLETSTALLEAQFSRYAIPRQKGLYQFPGSPVLSMKHQVDAQGNGGYAFNVHDIDLTNWKLFVSSPTHPFIDPRALYVIVRSHRVYAVIAWLFERYADGGAPIHSYAGRLAEGIGLGDPVSTLLEHMDLEFDTAEEFFMAEGLEIHAYGVSLEDEPEQIIMGLAVL